MSGSSVEDVVVSVVENSDSSDKDKISVFNGIVWSTGLKSLQVLQLKARF